MLFATKMQKYIGKPFKEGAYGPQAYDCVGLIWRYLRDEGVNVPDNWNGQKANNYFHLARGSKQHECDMLREWVLTLGKEIPVSSCVAGDILLLETLGIIFSGIYGGNNHLISVARHLGVRIIRIDNNHIKPITAIRWKKNG
jgi:cell wall-associated NlpC family hydrolase